MRVCVCVWVWRKWLSIHYEWTVPLTVSRRHVRTIDSYLQMPLACPHITHPHPLFFQLGDDIQGLISSYLASRPTKQQIESLHSQITTSYYWRNRRPYPHCLKCSTRSEGCSCPYWWVTKYWQ